MNECQQKYPPIEDYAMIGDGYSTALISKAASIDWCCMPRMDSDSCFGRLIDWDCGGYCSVAPTAENFTVERYYERGTLILVTCFKTPTGTLNVRDFFTVSETPEHHLVRIAECVSGEVEVAVKVSPRFDFGEIAPYIRPHDASVFTAWASNQGLVIYCDQKFEHHNHRDLCATFTLKHNEKAHLSLRFEYPERLNESASSKLNLPKNLNQRLKECRTFWKKWSSRIAAPYNDDPYTVRSALVLKGLTFERTGAIAAAATTSLPEWIGGERNWDYRYSWVRDSVFAVRALHELGYHREAHRFGEFIERSSAGSADELQVMYGVDGKRRLPEVELRWLEGYKGSQPVRVGNRAAEQLQLDIYAELMELAWLRHSRGEQTDDEYWDFLCEVVETVCQKWKEPDHGIWEVRDKPQHFVYSKALCWAAVNRGIELATQCGYANAPIQHWEQTLKEIRQEIDHRGYDESRGIYTQAFGRDYLDAAVLLLPRYQYIAYDDPRMIRTTQAVMEELDYNGLIQRYNSPDGLGGNEGAFLPCTFWLVCCLANQGRHELALDYYERALRCSNDLGLFSEEFDTVNHQMLGNFPQVLTHVSQITARLSLELAKSGGHLNEGQLAKVQNERQ